VKFRNKAGAAQREPAQVYGSTQIELAWTVIPILIVVVLFLATARVIHAIQDAPKPVAALEVTAIGHNSGGNLDIRRSGLSAGERTPYSRQRSRPSCAHIPKTALGDTDHSFWVPQLAGKTDLIPNRINEMWVDRIARAFFSVSAHNIAARSTRKCSCECRWTAQRRSRFGIDAQKQPVIQDEKETVGRRVFETTACVNCHAVGGTNATGRFGPDLTHLMSRRPIAAGAAENTKENLRLVDPEPGRHQTRVRSCRPCS